MKLKSTVRRISKLKNTLFRDSNKEQSKLSGARVVNQDIFILEVSCVNGIKSIFQKYCMQHTFKFLHKYNLIRSKVTTFQNTKYLKYVHTCNGAQRNAVCIGCKQALVHLGYG